jgi:GTP-binding protein Era
VFKSGFVAIIGRPNVGKSSFLNKILEEKISIITPKPQTTRDRILGIYTRDDCQIIFLDTPGIHVSGKELNRCMVDKALSALFDADLALVMAEPGDTIESLAVVFEHIKDFRKKAIFAFNKSDLLPEEMVLKKIDELSSTTVNFIYKQAISCITGAGLDILMNEILEILPEGPPFFPDDMITDASERFLCAEMIREKVFLLTQKEIPYSTAVEIEQFKEGEIARISAVIHVERSSQKGIVIGKGGSMLKRIGIQARIDMERLLGQKVFLELFVRVTEDWTKNPRELKRLGYK